MKKIRMGLMALAAVAGVSSSFAMNHKPRGVVTYYAKMINSTQAVWTANDPGNDCSQVSVLTCTITSPDSGVTGLAPNTFPAHYTPSGPADRAHK